MADNQKKIAVISRILRYIRKYIALVCLSLFLAVVSVVSSLAIPVLVGSTIDFMIEADRVDFGKVSMYLCTVLLCTGVCALSQWLMSPGELSQDQLLKMAEDCLNSLRRQRIEERLKTIAEQMPSLQGADKLAAMQEAQVLTKRLRQLKSAR